MDVKYIKFSLNNLRMNNTDNVIEIDWRAQGLATPRHFIHTSFAFKVEQKSNKDFSFPDDNNLISSIRSVVIEIFFHSKKKNKINLFFPFISIYPDFLGNIKRRL